MQLATMNRQGWRRWVELVWKLILSTPWWRSNRTVNDVFFQRNEISPFLVWDARVLYHPVKVAPGESSVFRVCKVADQSRPCWVELWLGVNFGQGVALVRTLG